MAHQPEEFFRWRQNVNIEGVPNAMLENSKSKLLQTAVGARNVMLPTPVRNLSRNLALFDVMMTLKEAESNEVMCLKWSDNSAHFGKVHVSGTQPQCKTFGPHNGFVAISAGDGEQTIFQDYARKLAALFAKFRGGVEFLTVYHDNNSVNMLEFLNMYKRDGIKKKSQIDAFKSMFTHSED